MLWSIRWSVVGLIILLPVTLWGAEINDVRTSCWDSTYQDEAGTFVVEARIQFNGESGTYTLPNGQSGDLTGLKYAYITPAPEKKVGIYGTWSMGGKSGGFTFRVTGDGQKFGGQWTGANNLRGTWRGKRE